MKDKESMQEINIETYLMKIKVKKNIEKIDIIICLKKTKIKNENKEEINIKTYQKKIKIKRIWKKQIS